MSEHGHGFMLRKDGVVCLVANGKPALRLKQEAVERGGPVGSEVLIVVPPGATVHVWPAPECVIELAGGGMAGGRAGTGYYSIRSEVWRSSDDDVIRGEPDRGERGEPLLFSEVECDDCDHEAYAALPGAHLRLVKEGDDG